MPFDGADFVPETSSRPPPTAEVPKLLWHGRMIRALRGALRPTSFSPSPEESDCAVVRLLQHARGLIASPDHWTRGTYEAAGGQRCTVGALLAARWSHDPDTLRQAYMELMRVALRRGFSTIEMMNDGSRHEHVLTALDEAIAAAQRRAVVAA